MDGGVSQTERADVDLLTGPHAGEILQAALDVDAVPLGPWRVHAVHHRPGAGVTVGYTVRSVSDGPDDYLCATTARLSAGAGPGLVRLADGARVIHVWRHPADPELPGLAAACSPDRVAQWLRLSSTPEVELLTYRPLRRAVVRVRSRQLRDGEVYVKVVRPRTVRELAERHALLVEAGVPAPRVLTSQDDGLVVLGAGVGTSLANMLAGGLDATQAREVFGSIIDTIDRIPAQVIEFPRRAAWAERAGHYGHAASVVLPEHAARIERLADGVDVALADTDAGPLVPTHGDLYEANLLMTEGRVSAVLDVDAVGPGHRVDDLACLLAHVSVLPHLAPATYPGVAATLSTWTAMSEERVDPHALRARTAGVVLSLVAGARRGGGAGWRRDAEGRLGEAERWLRSVGR